MGRGQELLEGARNGDVQVVEKILAQITRRGGPIASLRRGAGVNVQDSNGYTPLHHACVRGHKEIARLLLAADASPCLVDSKGASPLHLAAWVGATDIVRMLLVHNTQPANVDLLTNDHETALLYAAQFGHVEVVALLLSYGADVTVRNNRDESALDLAAQYGKLKIVRHLLSARPQLVDPYRAPASRRLTFSHTPLHRASINGHRDVVSALLDAGVDPNVLTPNGTALHEAALCGKESVVSLLIQRGVKLNAKDHAGRTVAMLLSEFPEKATQRVREAILRSGPSSSRYYESEDDLPAIPVLDQSPYENSSNSMRIRRSPSELYDERRVSNASMKTRETQKNIKLINNKSTANTSLTKIHPQSFVKKLASKCLGLKAKFNSAPNISNSGLESEVALKAKSDAQSNNTSTLLIGNSKFFKKLSRKDETGEMVCNDEFDTISLDRLGTLERESVVNRSNRSCPGFKVSLPNISENTELGDSCESLNSVIIVELDEISDTAVKNDLTEAINEKTINHIFEPRNSFGKRSKSPKAPLASFDSIHAVNDCYEPYEFSEKSINEIPKSDKPQPQPRHNLKQQNSIISNSLYENVVLDNNIIKPKPVARKKNNSFEDESIYENFPPNIMEKIKPKIKPQPPKRIFLPVQIPNNSINDNRVQTLSSSNTSRSTTPSSDSLVDESNLEDVLLSEKSYSFKHAKKEGSLPLSVKSVLNKSDSVLSNTSDVTEISAMENVDCSDETDKKLIYNSMTGTLPSRKSTTFDKSTILFRHKTFTSADADKDLSKIRDSMKWNNDFLTETLKSYHIRGTGHCIYQGPTVREFLQVFNRDNLYHNKTGSFRKYLKRDSYYETAICFCKPVPPKYHKSAEDLLKMPSQNDDAEVTIDTHALLQMVEMSTASFRCFCDDNLTCTLHHKKRESPNPLVVKFSAINKSISAPNITIHQTNVPLAKSKYLVKNKSFPKTENPYAVVDVAEIAARKVNYRPEISPTGEINSPLPSLTSTLSSTTDRPYSIKDVAEVISLTDGCSTLTDDASPTGAFCDNSVLRMQKTPTSSGFPLHWQLGTNDSNDSSKSDYNSFKSCFDDSDSDNGTLHSDGDSSSDNGTLKSDVSVTRRPWVDSDSFKFDNDTSSLPRNVIKEEDSSPSECGSLEGDASEEVGEGGSLVASLERARGAAGAVRSGSGRRRWDELEVTSEGDALSLSSAASSNAPHHMAHHYELSKVSPTPPKKPPRRNLSVSPTHANSPSSAYSYELRPHARSQDDLDDIQGAKFYLKHGRSVDQYVDGKLSYVEYEEQSPRAAPVPQPRPSLKHRVQPVAITTMCDDVVMKEQNPRRKLRRNNFTHQYENFEPVRVVESRRKCSRESLLDDNTPSDGEGRIPSSPTHYDQPPTPDHPPPSARQAENSIHERIRPLSQLIMEVIEEIRIRKKSEAEMSETS